MRLNKFRVWMINLLLICKLVVIGSAVFLFVVKGYSASQLGEIFYLIGPLFTANISIVAAFYLNKLDFTHKEKNKLVEGPLKTIGFGASILYSVFMVSLLFRYASLSGDPDSFTEMKHFMGWVEVFFGFYIGYVVSGIFKPRFE